MHTQPMADSDGKFGEYDHVDKYPCRKCGASEVRYRIWESSCGGYEDYHHKCFACGHSWWVEQEIEIEVSAGDAIAALMDLDEPVRLPMALSGISACHGWLKRIPDSLISEMNEKQRGLIVAAFEEQAARYKTPNAELTGRAGHAGEGPR